MTFRFRINNHHVKLTQPVGATYFFADFNQDYLSFLPLPNLEEAVAYSWAVCWNWEDYFG